MRSFQIKHNNIKSVVIGLSGTDLTNNEITLIKKYRPFGFILFSRNYKNPNSFKALIKKIRNIVKRDCPILIDQEGGRVQRLSRPHFLKYPPAKLFGDLAKFNIYDDERAVYLNYLLLGSELTSIGINVNCAPCLDILSEDTHSIIGDRSFSNDEIIVARLGKKACEGLLDNKVIPVIKHIPGHGKAKVDSHEFLPEINDSLIELEKKDFYPFKYLSYIPMAMTAHITYSNIDSLNPVTTSKKAYKYIRKQINYNGILITDDICMKALSGSLEKKIKKIYNAGYDLILHCSGKEEETKELLEFAPIINNNVLEKWSNSLDINKNVKLENTKNIINEINEILAKYLKLQWNYY